MAIRNDQYLHRLTAGRGAIKPDDPLEVRLYGPDGKPIGVQDDALKVALSGSNLALRQTIVTGVKTVTSTAAEIFAGSSRLAGRHAMVITNVGVDHVYIGASGVTTGNGFPLFPGDTVRLDFDPANSVPVFAVSGGPDVEVRVVELA